MYCGAICKMQSGDRRGESAIFFRKKTICPAQSGPEFSNRSKSRRGGRGAKRAGFAVSPLAKLTAALIKNLQRSVWQGNGFPPCTVCHALAPASFWMREYGLDSPRDNGSYLNESVRRLQALQPAGELLRLAKFQFVDKVNKKARKSRKQTCRQGNLPEHK